MKTILTTAILGCWILSHHVAYASEVTGLISYSAGTPARSADVNANFTAVKTAVDDNHGRVAALESANALLQTDNTNLNARLTELEAKLASMSIVSVNDQPTVRFEGVNVQIVNGLDSTTSINGTGNLIVGYDEVRTSGVEVCSLGFDNNGVVITDITACSAAGGTFAINHKSGSHNLVVGPQNNYSRASGIVIGYRNTINGAFASVSGGQNNKASGTLSIVSGGESNTASGFLAVVSGGAGNAASGQFASVSGGNSNTASAFNASVSGGLSNTASGSYSSISGGNTNTASGSSSSVSGGVNNTANATTSSVHGGRGNTASGVESSVSGGNNRSATGVDNWVAGTLFQTN